LTPGKVGNFSLSATYTPDTTAGVNFTGNSSTPGTALSVGAAKVGSTFASSANPSAYGQTVTLTGMVTAVAGGVTPTGNVSFSIDGSAICTASVLSPTGVAGTVSATCVAPQASLTVGSHALVFSYGGDANNQPASNTLTQVVTKDTTSITLGAAPNPAMAGQPVTLTATVFGDPPTGTVTFFDGTTKLGAAQLATLDATSSSATLTVNGLSAGTHTLSAVYAGDDNNEASAAGDGQTVLLVNAAIPTPALTPWMLALLALLLGGMGYRAASEGGRRER
jgi:hypothetical protein